MFGSSLIRPTKKQIRFLGFGLLGFPPCGIMVSLIFQNQLNSPEPVTWLMDAVYWSIGISIFYFAFTFWIARALSGRMGAKLKAKDTDPNVFLLLIGITTAILPSIFALFLTPFGLPFLWTLFVGSFSFFVLLAWLLFFRPKAEKRIHE